jgi:hypothetical protein
MKVRGLLMSQQHQLSTKVVIESRHLRGAEQGFLQKVATVYVDGEEYRVFAPSKAVGDALDWVPHFCVKQPDDECFASELTVDGVFRAFTIKLVEEKLQEMKRDTNRTVGMNPDNRFYDAQICTQGHVHSVYGFPFQRGEHCKTCGAVCIDECPHCKTPIRGQSTRPSCIPTEYDRPAFCHSCGRPYPWMEDALSTARDLLWHDDKLSLEERQKLWDLLQYVMSDPKADLVPAKRKLIEIKLEKAGKVVREFVVDLIARYAAEMSKG